MGTKRASRGAFVSHFAFGVLLGLRRFLHSFSSGEEECALGVKQHKKQIQHLYFISDRPCRAVPSGCQSWTLAVDFS